MLLTAAAGNDHNNNNNVPAPSNATVCWKGTHDRGVGTVPDSCNATAGLEKSGALCCTCDENKPTLQLLHVLCYSIAALPSTQQHAIL